MKSSVVQHGISIEIVEMVSFELGEELRKMFFRLVTSVGQRKIPSSHEKVNLRPSDLHSSLPQSVKRCIKSNNVKLPTDLIGFHFS